MSQWRNFLLFLVAAVWWFVNWKKIWVIFDTSWLRRILFHMFKTRVARFRVENAMTSRWYWKMEIHQRSIKKVFSLTSWSRYLRVSWKNAKIFLGPSFEFWLNRPPHSFAYSETSQLTKMECFAKVRNGFLRNR